ncbi:beta-lactamase family protein [Flagellimonas sp. HMM57]|uniref:serine hydrolase domain-containing protein n=1 Tax=unclassified Flagellimonas TaxID=2644544 RepID=UPI0013D404E7|nr:MULTISPECIES: serine hydrolase domain-containing protein [unclassified Flagellimonas]UII76242.1 beta-lactamase family protein [Flagellimonas sp. HMM57]
MKIYLSILFALISTIIFSQKKEYGIGDLENKLDSLIIKTMESEHIPGASFIIVKDGKTLLKKGYGYTTLDKNAKTVNPDSTIFRIGSITKTFTITALLQLKDKNLIDIHKDVNQYLKSVKVPTTYSEPVTASHLMTHSAGFDELRGRVVYEKDQQISLETFLDGKLIRLRKPGIVSAYSTFGIALAGLLVEDISGLSLEEYMKKNIWQPLGMSMTSIELPKHQNNNLSIGYEYENGINVPQPWEWYHTFPASSINSTTADMGKYLQMHLNLGKLNNTKILNTETALSMQTQQLSVNSEVYGFGYGFYEKNQFGLKAYNHGGDMLGYSSFITLVPEINLGIFVVHHHENTNLRAKVVSQVLEHFGTNDVINTNPERMHSYVSDFAGTYKWMSNCYTCPDSDQQPTYEITANDDNTLSGFGRKFYQVEPLLFKSYDGKRIMGFLQNENGKIKYMSLGNVNAFEKME